MTNRDRDVALVVLAALVVVAITTLAVAGNPEAAIVTTLGTLGGTALGRLSSPRPEENPQPVENAVDGAAGQPPDAPGDA
jgi:regulator of protease activity HflC (stomatin/prohibitin superfamily)